MTAQATPTDDTPRTPLLRSQIAKLLVEKATENSVVKPRFAKLASENNVPSPGAEAKRVVMPVLKAKKPSKAKQAPALAVTAEDATRAVMPVLKACKKVAEIPLEFTEKLRNATAFWEPLLTQLVPEFEQVYRKRTGMDVPSSFWFSQWHDPRVRHKVILGLMHVPLTRLDDFAARLPFALFHNEKEKVIAAARLLVRLVDISRGAFSDLCAWFGRGQDELGWFSGIAALARTNFSIGAVSFEHLLWVFDSYYDFTIRFCKLPNSYIAELSKSKESGRDSYGKMCWNLTPLATILRFAYLQSMHPLSVLTVLWTKEREHCLRKAYIPSLRPEYLVKHLPAISVEECARIPRYDQAHLVDWQFAFGLAGDVKLPDKIVFGWDFSKVHASGLRPVAVTDGGQVVYKDAKGVVTSEGHPLQQNAAVKAWGSPALIVYMTKENYAELLPYWYNPPALCPWSWYSRFGNGIYREDGTALHPDARLRPSVTWLERAK